MVTVSIVCFHLCEASTGVLEGGKSLLGIILFQCLINGHNGCMNCMGGEGKGEGRGGKEIRREGEGRERKKGGKGGRGRKERKGGEGKEEEGRGGRMKERGGKRRKEEIEERGGKEIRGKRGEGVSESSINRVQLSVAVCKLVTTVTHHHCYHHHG